MTREEFEAALARLGINQTVFAEITGINRNTVYGWGTERTTGPGRRMLQAVPQMAVVLIAAWQVCPRALATEIKRLRNAED